MSIHPARLLPLTLLCFFLGSCYYSADPVYSAQPANGPAYVPAPTTALVIVMQDDSTEADYLNWRGRIIDYLIQRGYIANESDLVANPDYAQRIVRAIVHDGGFTLSVFNQEGPLAAGAAPPDLEDSDVCYPDDPYYILGFAYVGEIGLRRLPPRPSGYRPHPRPPGARPPDHHDYDRDRHWPGTHNNSPDNRARPTDHQPDDRNDHRGQPRNDQPHNPPPQPNRPPATDHRDEPGRDNHPTVQPPAKPAQPDHRPDNRPGPERNDQPHDRPGTPLPRPVPAANPPPSQPARPVERPAPPPPPPKQESKPDRGDSKNDDDKRNQQER